MSASVPEFPRSSAESVASGRRRRALLVLILLLVALGLWWGWRRFGPSEVPEIPLADVDPAIATAVREAQEEIRQRPRSAEAWGKLGMVLWANQLHERAGPIFARAAALDPQDERWPYLHGVALAPLDPEAALPHLRRAAEICQGGSEHQAATHLRLAEVLLASGLHDEAESQLRRIEPLIGENPCARYGLGVVALTRGNLADGKQHLQRCADSPLTRQKATVQLAALCKRLGDDQAAAAHADTARQAPPDLPWPDPYLAACQPFAVGRKNLLERFTALEQQGDWTKALQVARELIRAYPDAASFETLGITLGRVGQYQESERYLRKCLELQPQAGRRQHYLSLALFAQAEALERQADKKAESLAKLRESVEWARKAVAVNDRHAEAHFQLGLALTCLEERPAAIQSFRRAVQARPELAESHLWLGKTLADEGQTQEALIYLENAVRLAPANDGRAAQALQDVRKKQKPGP